MLIDLSLMLTRIKNFLYTALFLSGFSALIYELIWERKLELVLGSTARGITIVLSTFFAGLAIGTFVFGKLADRIQTKKQLLVIYASLELFIGITSLISVYIFGSGNQLSFLYLIIPATLIGGTFPLITKYFSSSDDLKNNVGILYSLNTLGGLAGVVVLTWFLIVNFGVNTSLIIAAAVNILIGEGAFFFSNFLANSDLIKEKQNKANFKSGGAGMLLIAFLTGFLALFLELSWSRFLVLVYGNSIYAFAVVLAATLAGILLGSFVAYQVPINRIKTTLFLALFASGIYIILTVPFYDRLPELFLRLLVNNPTFSWTNQSRLVICFLTFLPVMFFSGLSFPLIVGLYKNKALGVGGKVGAIYSLNTIGGILGPLAGYFLILPKIGFQNSFILASVCYFILSAIILNSKKVYIFVLITGSILVFGNLLFFSWNKVKLTLGIYQNPNLTEAGRKLIYYKEGENEIVSVRQSLGGNMSMSLSGKVDASNYVDLDSEVLLGHLGMLFSKNHDRILVIGQGSGITSGSVGTYNAGEIDIVEIEKNVIEASKLFSKDNHDILNDSRVKVIIDDVRHYLSRIDIKYDVIISQPTNLKIAGMTNLFSKEFYEIAKSHLESGGIMLQWIQNYDLSPDTLKIAIRTYTNFFPYVYIWSGYHGANIFLIGSDSPLASGNVIVNYNSEKVRKDLQRIGVNDARQIYDFYIADRPKILGVVGQGVTNSDDLPVLEFNAPRDYLPNYEDDTLPFLNRMVETFPGESESFNVRNLLLQIRKGLTDSSIDRTALFEKLLLLRPNNDYIKGMYSSCLGKEADGKELGQAEKLLRRAVEVSPNDFFSNTLLGQTYLEEGKIDLAIEILTKSNAIEPGFSDTHGYLGMAYLVKKDFKMAETELLKATANDNTNYIAWKSLGDTYIALGKKKDAIIAYNKSLLLKPGQLDVEDKILKLQSQK